MIKTKDLEIFSKTVDATSFHDAIQNHSQNLVEADGELKELVTAYTVARSKIIRKLNRECHARNVAILLPDDDVG